MIPSLSFALARNVRLAAPQKANLVRFSDAGISLLRGHRVVMEIPWAEVDKLRYTQGATTMPRLIHTLAGSFFQRREASFTVVCADGEVLELMLELDSLYRKQELVGLFAAFYEAGVGFEERGRGGEGLYLLEPK